MESMKPSKNYMWLVIEHCRSVSVSFIHFPKSTDQYATERVSQECNQGKYLEESLFTQKKL